VRSPENNESHTRAPELCSRKSTCTLPYFTLPIALPRPPSRYKGEGREGGKRKGLGIVGREEEGEGKDVKGREKGRGKEGWKGSNGKGEKWQGEERQRKGERG